MQPKQKWAPKEPKHKRKEEPARPKTTQSLKKPMSPRKQQVQLHGKMPNRVDRPVMDKGFLVQRTNLRPILTAWDEQLVAKCHPGEFNVPYVAGMNVSNLPTTCFTVSNSFSDANVYGDFDQSPLGTSDYTLLMWSSSMTAFSGENTAGQIPATDRLGGLVMKMINASDLDSAWITRSIFTEIQSAYTMLETYGSDMTGFSAGGFVWASEATFNVLAPAANIVGSFYRGTL